MESLTIFGNGFVTKEELEALRTVIENTVQVITADQEEGEE
jgi:hypothetical protein